MRRGRQLSRIEISPSNRKQDDNYMSNPNPYGSPKLPSGFSPPATKPIRCPRCQYLMSYVEKESEQDIACKECHHLFQVPGAGMQFVGSYSSRAHVSARPRPVFVNQSPANFQVNRAAAICSLFLPGLGQMVFGKPLAGFAWLLGTIISYPCLIFPGLLVHAICVVNAAKIPKVDYDGQRNF